MSIEAIEKIAEGRVWTGSAAQELGLVDELGGLDKALSIASLKAGIENYSIISYPEEENLLLSLMNDSQENYVESQISQSMGEYYPYVKFLKNIQNQDRIQARIPFDLHIQ